MKIYYLFFLSILILGFAGKINANSMLPIDLETICSELIEELEHNQKLYRIKHLELNDELMFIRKELLKKNKKKKIHELKVKELEIELALVENENAFVNNSISIRYRKGLDLIKLLYEKVLGLEHHFTGLSVYQNIEVLSNPNSYPEFSRAKDLIAAKKETKPGFKLPSLLESNPFMSATFSLVSAVLGSNNKKTDSSQDFDKIACVLDFTVRMNGDLNTIRHEVEFLKKSNENLKRDCEKLFEEYVKVVGYLVPLETCRNDDDWEDLRMKIDDYMESIGEGTTTTTFPGQQNQGTPSTTTNRDKVNLEFATRRVSDFIIKYIDFTTKGTQYYEKFDSIVSTYENEQTCQEIFPREFTELKFDIKSTIEKFNNTYNLPEIQGSRLKNLMYGVD